MAQGTVRARTKVGTTDMDRDSTPHWSRAYEACTCVCVVKSDNRLRVQTCCMRHEFRRLYCCGLQLYDYMARFFSLVDGFSYKIHGMKKKRGYNMPYANATQQRDYMDSYRKHNPDRVESYHRNLCMKRALQGGRFPSIHSIRKYKITENELLAIVRN